MNSKKTPPHFYQALSVFKKIHALTSHCNLFVLSAIRYGWVFFLLCFSLCLPTIATATDLAKEKRWAEQISDALLDGEAIQLNNGKHDFLAIETQADEANELGVIILHGIGIHPDWPAVIQPLRVELALAGWNTLSLQLPVLKNEAEGKDYEPLMSQVPARIDAGIKHLAKQGTKKIAIVAHSLGARMASYYLANKKIYQEAHSQTPIVVFVSIGMGTDEKDYFGKIKLPILDIYGDADLPAVLDSAPQRAKSSSTNNAYKQIKVPEANHFFDDQDEVLIQVVSDALTGF